MQDSPEKGQIKNLIGKADKILTKDSILLSVQIDAINLNIETSNLEKYDLLKKKFNRYNEITLLFTELEQFTYVFKLQKQGSTSRNTICSG